MTDRKPEEWRPVPDWPGFEVSSLGRVRKVRLLVGNNLVLRVKGRTITTTAQALFARAFGRIAIGTASRVPRRDLWRTVRSFLKTHDTATTSELRREIARNDLEEHGIITQDDEAMRHRVSIGLGRYLKEGLIMRVGVATYALTDKGEKTSDLHRKARERIGDQVAESVDV